MLAALPLVISFLALVQGVVMFLGVRMLDDVGGSCLGSQTQMLIQVKFSVCTAVYRPCVLSSLFPPSDIFCIRNDSHWVNSVFAPHAPNI